MTSDLRKESLRKLTWNAGMFTIYWISAGVALYYIFTEDTAANDEYIIIQNRSISYLFAMMAGGLGVFDAVTWFAIHKQEFWLLIQEWRFSPAEIRAKMGQDLKGTSAGDISMPLRREFIAQTTAGIKAHLSRHLNAELSLRPGKPGKSFLGRLSFSSAQDDDYRFGDDDEHVCSYYSEHTAPNGKEDTVTPVSVQRKSSNRKNKNKSRTFTSGGGIFYDDGKRVLLEEKDPEINAATIDGSDEVMSGGNKRSINKKHALSNRPGRTDRFDIKAVILENNTGDAATKHENVRDDQLPSTQQQQQQQQGSDVQRDQKEEEDSTMGGVYQLMGQGGGGSRKSLFCKLEYEENIEFRAYEWRRFAYLRDLWGIDEEDLIEELSAGVDKMITNFSEGASGSFFFFTADKQYIVKTMSRSELRAMRRILPAYCRHMTANRASLICKFLGIYALDLFNHTEYFSVMNNVLLPPEGHIHLKYDLKGSRVNRTGKKGSSTLKDNDFHIPLELTTEARSRVLRQLQADTHFLSSKNIMDYSLLVGVQNYTYKTDDDKKLNNVSSHSSLEILAAARVRAPGMYYIGIIDVLQEWDWNKWLERAAKIMFQCRCTDYQEISCVPPKP
mmetsp:Transcript_24052/g.38661  ORF Transcript_24052/g.38661 Transcript_24052/m.38661 type:complete len:615 (+) Transcript_24052:216-2060(+)